jgi:hypothetical protein
VCGGVSQGVFSKVAAQFYQTMAKAQGNYSIKEVYNRTRHTRHTHYTHRSG